MPPRDSNSHPLIAVQMLYSWATPTNFIHAQIHTSNRFYLRTLGFESDTSGLLDESLSHWPRRLSKISPRIIINLKNVSMPVRTGKNGARSLQPTPKVTRHEVIEYTWVGVKIWKHELVFSRCLRIGFSHRNNLTKKVLLLHSEIKISTFNLNTTYVLRSTVKFRVIRDLGRVYVENRCFNRS